jgi:predicted transcriptional regulator
MSMTLRTTPEIDKALDEAAKAENLSKQQVVLKAIEEYTSRRRQLRDEALARILREDAALLARLAE